MSGRVQYKNRGRFACAELSNPPVNALSADMIADLRAMLDRFDADGSAEALVILAAGRLFCAGGDIAEFDRPDFSPTPLNEILLRMESSTRPVIAIIDGAALGGGVELAMACHARFATPAASFGMPEVKLGLLPGSHGTQRLPRLIGLEAAMDLILSGKTIGADAALALGLIDELVSDRDAAFEIIAARLAPIRRTRDLPVAGAEKVDQISNDARCKRRTVSVEPAIPAILDAMTAAATLSFESGCAVELRHFMALKDSRASHALRHVFTAERAARILPGITSCTPMRKVKRVGILGVGTMGAGIATAFANAQFDVVLVETTSDALARGQGIIAATYAATVRRGLITKDDADARLARMSGHTDMAALSGVDMVVEAVFENMDLKLDVARKLGAIVKPGGIIATNTSTLDVDKIAMATGRPADVIGTHFFSPAHIMKLLEVVRGAHTAPDVLRAVMSLAAQIGKIPVVSGVCYGFIGNRMAEVYGRENEAMQLEGATPAEIDGVIEDPAWLGMAMGPSRMLDMAGVDVGAKTVIEWIASGAGPRDPAYRILCRTMKEQNLHGQKTGEGYYLYGDGAAHSSQRCIELAADIAKEYGVARRETIPKEEIFERLFFPMVNEAALILEEGIAYRPGDIDLVWTAGYGFPRWRGGPLFMADEIGLERIVKRMDAYASRNPDAPYWEVAPLLRALARNGARLSEWQRPTDHQDRKEA